MQASPGPACRRPGAIRGEPDIYYPTGSRNYVRVLPPDDMHGAAHALLAKDLGLRRVYLLQDDTDLRKGQLIDPFRYAARRLDVPIAGSAVYDPEDERFDELVDQVARSGADGIVLAADPFIGGDRLLKALRERLGTRVTIMAGFYFSYVPDVLELAGPAARGVYVTTSDLPRAELDLSPAPSASPRTSARPTPASYSRRHRRRSSSSGQSPAPTARGRPCSRS